MLKVALTGGLATGKSYVRGRIASSGVPTVDADAIVHELFASGSETSRDIVGRFGPEMVEDGGAVDRRALGALVFADAEARRALEAIVHPRVYVRIVRWMSAQAARGAVWALVEIPLLFETGHEGDYDRVIVAACSPEEQVRRVVERDGLPEAAARARLAAQWPIAEKARRATDVIDTSDGLEGTDRQVDAVCATLNELGRVLAREVAPPPD
jgi:dephospho-CoA kinase